MTLPALSDPATPRRYPVATRILTGLCFLLSVGCNTASPSPTATASPPVVASRLTVPTLAPAGAGPTRRPTSASDDGPAGPTAAPTTVPVSPTARPAATLTVAPTASPTTSLEPTVRPTSPPPSPTPVAAADAPAILTFVANVAEADPGDTITLSWTSRNADRLTLYSLMASNQLGAFWEVTANGSFDYPIREWERNHTQFMLFADAAGPQASASLTVRLRCTGDWFIADPPDVCPFAAPRASPAAEQPFERGRMIWLGAEDRIIVLFDDGQSPRWAVYTDNWDDGDPIDDPAIIPPAGRFQPIRGFGLVWREGYGEVRSRLGWATGPETGYMAVIQQTSYWKYNHTYLRALDGGVWHLLPERSNWEWLAQ